MRSIDLKLIVPSLVLAVASLLALLSISKSLFLNQLLWFAIGAALFVVFYFIEWRPFVNYAWVMWGIYGITLAALLITLFLAPTIRGTRSWLVLGPIQFQPAELAKAALIIMLAHYFSRKHIGIAKIQSLILPTLYFAIPAGLILLQPDMGSTLILFAIWFGFLLVSGLPVRRIMAFLFIFALAGGILWTSFLKEYQRDRLIALFSPEHDPLGVNYNVIQSKIAIGSAGILGKGFKQGSQVQLGFLPEAATDFILAAFVEEWGLLLAIAVVGALLFLIQSILSVGLKAERNFEKFICLGVAIMFGVHFVINAGSTLGLLPVIGVTFPFLSYGGSSILINSWLLAIVNSIAKRI